MKIYLIMTSPLLKVQIERSIDGYTKEKLWNFPLGVRSFSTKKNNNKKHGLKTFLLNTQFKTNFFLDASASQ